MASLLIVYDTTEGQTRKIAGYVADAVARLGHPVQLHAIRELPLHFTVVGTDGVIVGGSIHMGKHSRGLAKFLTNHGPDLEAVPSAFFSVSLSAAGSDEEQQRAVGYVEDVLTQSGWRPNLTAIFAGGLLYRRYGLIKRWLMKRIARDAGKDTDTARDHEYTDWAAVDRFVNKFLTQLGPGI